jgi:hypothetical protein
MKRVKPIRRRPPCRIRRGFGAPLDAERRECRDLGTGELSDQLRPAMCLSWLQLTRHWRQCRQTITGLVGTCRARYSGDFDPAQIPGSAPAYRERADILNYRSGLAPKAAAFTPVGGRVFTVVGAASQRTAEEESLKACDADPLRKRRERFVLPVRRRRPYRFSIASLRALDRTIGSGRFLLSSRSTGGAAGSGSAQAL